MIELAYTSTASPQFTAKDLKAILTTSRANNMKFGITGMLLFRGQTFLQLLEGETEAIYSLYRNLLQDSRHYGVTLLYDRPLAQRAFGKWSMAFEHVPDTEPMPDDLHRLTLNGISPALNLSPGSNRLISTFLQHVR